MAAILVKKANLLVTMDDHRREISGDGFIIRDGFIERVGVTENYPTSMFEGLKLRLLS